MITSAMASRLDLSAGTIEGAAVTRRYLGDLKGSFADAAAFNRAAQEGNPLLYQVSAVEPGQGEGQLHYGLGMLMPGRIGREYYLTKGHYHAWRAAAEVYCGLRGEGLMLLEDETGACSLLELRPNGIVYVPGHTAHRTINTGAEPLVYLGIYPATAGHDYAPVAAQNFRKVVVEQNGRPVMLDRSAFTP
jgi:glucose-6-phosphate isomerase